MSEVAYTRLKLDDVKKLNMILQSNTILISIVSFSHTQIYHIGMLHMVLMTSNLC
jgi:hypothetical protein